MTGYAISAVLVTAITTLLGGTPLQSMLGAAIAVGLLMAWRIRFGSEVHREGPDLQSTHGANVCQDPNGASAKDRERSGAES